MNAIVKSPFAWLLKREYWEERRGLLWSQVTVAGVLIILSIFGIIAAEVARVHMGDSVHFVSGGNLSQALQNAASHNSEGLAQAVGGMMWTFGLFAGVVLSFKLFFYLLGALYEDRKDRSILFWKSLPVSDTATVLSKVVTAILVMPVIAVVVALAGFIGEMIIASIWFAAHGLNPFTLLWAHATPWTSWLHMLATIPINAVWALPAIGWLLFWSAAARSKPFLWAVMIPVVAGVLNSWIALLGIPHINIEFFWSNLVARPLLSVIPGSWVTDYVAQKGGTINIQPGNISGIDSHLGSYGAMYHTFLTPNIWIGAAVGIVLIAAAIWFRRWRDEV
ncbi:MAG: ABC-2 transporter permease [Proteobacteria bacterium]|nr:ABC-2 transporter permease [Pseudomonadota bacterium]